MLAFYIYERDDIISLKQVVLNWGHLNTPPSLPWDIYWRLERILVATER